MGLQTAEVGIVWPSPRLAEAGHEVQIFLLGEATSLMRKATAVFVGLVEWADRITPSELFPRIHRMSLQKDTDRAYIRVLARPGNSGFPDPPGSLMQRQSL